MIARVVKAGLAYFGLVFGTGFLLGIVRVPLLVAELSLATALQSQSIAEYVASRDPVSGTVYLAMLVVFAAMPAALALKSNGTRPSPSAL